MKRRVILVQERMCHQLHSALKSPTPSFHPSDRSQLSRAVLTPGHPKGAPRKTDSPDRKNNIHITLARMAWVTQTLRAPEPALA